MDEKQYRKLTHEVFNRVERAFDEVDPDVAECENSQGALSIQFADRSRCILSTQPSVRQIWVAVASKGVALHFDFDPQSQQWRDDKTKQTELFEFLSGIVNDSAGLSLKL